MLIDYFEYMRVVILILMLILVVPIAFSATIYGTIYDLSLDKAKNIRVEVNTEPNQFYISKNGSYAFNVPSGSYTVKAEQYIGNLLKASVIENITIKDDGTYVLDLILFPVIEEELEDDIELIEIPEKKSNFINNFVFIVILLLIIFLIYWIYFFKKRKREKGKIIDQEEKVPEDDLKKVIDIIKEEGGRTTQKDIRKKMPLSEAKISLLIAELEHTGKIKKIKKGRGNIIILNK